MRKEEAQEAPEEIQEQRLPTLQDRIAAEAYIKSMQMGRDIPDSFTIDLKDIRQQVADGKCVIDPDAEDY